jgi:hypothetical protein
MLRERGFALLSPERGQQEPTDRSSVPFRNWTPKVPEARSTVIKINTIIESSCWTLPEDARLADQAHRTGT